MRSFRLVILLLLAAILVAEPVVHTHPFGGGGDGAGVNSQSVCAMCAIAAQQITVVRVTIAPPLTVVDQLVAAPTDLRSFLSDRSLPSRGPPAS